MTTYTYQGSIATIMFIQLTCRSIIELTVRRGGYIHRHGYNLAAGIWYRPQSVQSDKCHTVCPTVRCSTPELAPT